MSHGSNVKQQQSAALLDELRSFGAANFDVAKHYSTMQRGCSSDALRAAAHCRAHLAKLRSLCSETADAELSARASDVLSLCSLLQDTLVATEAAASALLRLRSRLESLLSKAVVPPPQPSFGGVAGDTPRTLAEDVAFAVAVAGAAEALDFAGVASLFASMKANTVAPAVLFSVCIAFLGALRSVPSVVLGRSSGDKGATAEVLAAFAALTQEPSAPSSRALAASSIFLPVSILRSQGRVMIATVGSVIRHLRPLHGHYVRPKRGTDLFPLVSADVAAADVRSRTVATSVVLRSAVAAMLREWGAARRSQGVVTCPAVGSAGLLGWLAAMVPVVARAAVAEIILYAGGPLSGVVCQLRCIVDAVVAVEADILGLGAALTVPQLSCVDVAVAQTVHRLSLKGNALNIDVISSQLGGILRQLRSSIDAPPQRNHSTPPAVSPSGDPQTNKDPECVYGFIIVHGPGGDVEVLCLTSLVSVIDCCMKLVDVIPSFSALSSAAKRSDKMDCAVATAASSLSHMVQSSVALLVETLSQIAAIGKSDSRAAHSPKQTQRFPADSTLCARCLRSLSAVISVAGSLVFLTQFLVPVACHVLDATQLGVAGACSRSIQYAVTTASEDHIRRHLTGAVLTILNAGCVTCVDLEDSGSCDRRSAVVAFLRSPLVLRALPPSLVHSILD